MYIDTYNEYRTFLRDTLSRRQTTNTSYSLRAFARDLEVPAPHLSCILRGSKGISVSTALKIAQKLDMKASDRSRFLLLVQQTDARAAKVRAAATAKIHQGVSKKFLELKKDVYHLISDWYHYSILELAEIQRIQLAPKPLSSLLGIREDIAKEALARLIRLGFLIKEGKTWKKSQANLTTTDGVPSEAIRETNRQLINKALMALETQSTDERDFSTVTFAINPAKLKDAKRVIAAFRRQMIDLLEEKPQSELYCLTVQLFRLTNDPIN